MHYQVCNEYYQMLWSFEDPGMCIRFVFDIYFVSLCVTIVLRFNFVMQTLLVSTVSVQCMFLSKQIAILNENASKEETAFRTFSIQSTVSIQLWTVHFSH